MTDKRRANVEEQINTLGNILQTTGTIAGISVALFALLKTVKLDIPPGVLQLLVFEVVLTLFGSGCSLWALANRVGVWNEKRWDFQFSFGSLILAIVLLIIVFFLFVFDINISIRAN